MEVQKHQKSVSNTEDTVDKIVPEIIVAHNKSTAGDLHIFTLPFLANQALASLLQFFPKRYDDGFSIGGVLLPLVLVDTYNIAAL